MAKRACEGQLSLLSAPQIPEQDAMPGADDRGSDPKDGLRAFAVQTRSAAPAWIITRH
jgi:hypothetical protein